MSNENNVYLISFKNRDSRLQIYSDCIVIDNARLPIFMSLVGDDSSLKAFIARVHNPNNVVREFEFQAVPFNGSKNIPLRVSYHRFKSYVSVVGDLSHALLISRDFVDRPKDDEEKRFSDSYLIVKDGDCAGEFTRFMMQKTDTPFLPEWGRKVFDDQTKNGVAYISVYKTLGNSPLRMMRVGNDWDRVIQLSIKDGVIDIPESDIEAKITKDMSVSKYLSQNSEHFAKKINTAYVPRYRVGDPVSPLMDDLTRKPFPAQETAIQGVTNTLKERNAAVVVGEMGTGKTLIGASIPYVHAAGKPYRVIVMSPGHLVKKWKREIEQTVPGALATIVKDWRHLAQLYAGMDRKPSGREYYIISRDRAKLGYFTRCAAKWDARKNAWICPDCGQVLTAVEKQKDVWYHWSKKKVDVDVPAPKEHFNKPKKSNRTCRKCNANLWTADNERVRRYAPAEFIKRKMRGYFDYFIADEVHELKGTSAQGNVLGALASSARKTIALTGTLLGGYAGDLFYILYRLNAGRMKAVENLSYTDATKWERRYGAVERITKFSDEDFNVSSRGSSKKTQVKKRPGVSPLVFVNHLLDCCAFVELSDIENALPSYEEIVKPVEMEPEHRAAYTHIAHELEQKIKDFKEGQRYIGTYLTNLLAYPDQPFDAKPIRSPIDGDTIVTPRNLPKDTIYPKERELIDIIRKEHAEGRRVFVYATYTGKRAIQNRLKSVIESNVPAAKVALLETKVKPEKREEWITKEIKAGANVIVGNPRLVETGIDLTGENNCPTLVFYQTGYSLFTLRQASRRSWRIGQTEKVRVYFLAYKDTLQYAAIQLMGAKMEAAMSIEGKFSDEGLRAMSGDLDMTAMLAKAITEGISGVDSAEEIFGRLNNGRK